MIRFKTKLLDARGREGRVDVPRVCRARPARSSVTRGQVAVEGTLNGAAFDGDARSGRQRRVTG